MKLDQHPTVVRLRTLPSSPVSTPNAAAVRALCLEAGADDVGFAAVDRAELADQRTDALAVLPGARTYVSLVVRMNRDSVRTPARSVANREFHDRVDHVDAAAYAVARRLEALGVRAVATGAGFPMEMDRFPGKTWVLSHKPIAVAAGLGQMGLHRNLIHPRFGNFVLLGTVVTDLALDEAGRALDYNPCIDCKLCVSACPVGAIHDDGRFDFSACLTHNYREFMSGFGDWVGTIADSRDRRDYEERVAPSESASMWQSLSFGANYKAAYCMAVCPAGEDVLGPFLAQRQRFLAEVVRPLQHKVEPVYVLGHSEARAHVERRFPDKQVRVVRGGLRVPTLASLLRGLRLTFQPELAGALAARYHFRWSGAEARDATIDIHDGCIAVSDGCEGVPDLEVRVDGALWLALTRGERSFVWALVTRRLRLRGPLRLLRAFGRCFAH